MKIKTKKAVKDFIVSNGNCVTTSEGKKYYYLPNWYEVCEDGLLNEIPYTLLPTDAIKAIEKERDTPNNVSRLGLASMLYPLTEEDVRDIVKDNFNKPTLLSNNTDRIITMNTDKHTVTIPIEDYNKMLVANERYELLESVIKSRFEALQQCGIAIEGLNLGSEPQFAQMNMNHMGNQVNVRFVTPKQK